MEALLYQIVGACFAIVVLFQIWSLVNWALMKPRRIEKALREQGFKGNAYKLLVGDLSEMAKMREELMLKPIALDDDIKPRVLHYIFKTVQQYGNKSFYWQGPKPIVIITEPAHIKEIVTKMKEIHKMQFSNPLMKMFAPGLVSLEEDQWAKHRQIINPVFHQERLKLMVPAFRASCEEVLKEWEKLVSPQGSAEIDVRPYVKSITCDAISRTAFGSSYKEGKKIFELLQEQCELVVKSLYSLYIPGFRFLPTGMNKRMKEIERQVRPTIQDIIKKRIEESKAGKAKNADLLSIMVECNLKEIEEHGNKSFGMSIDEIVDECKVFYFGGHDTTSTLLSTTMILLSRHQDWQKKAREEVLNVFGKHKPNHEGLNHLKIVTMILHEVSRLYPSVATLDRHVMKETKVGELTLPAGVGIVMPFLLLHHNRDVWGDDALEFNPQRFSEGVAKAQKGENMYFPFGWGPRNCIGQNFLFVEAKVILSMILQRFSFELSPSFTHAPHTVFTLQHQHGVHLIMHKL